MCGRLVNLDTVARVIADYYHLKTDTQLAALNEALSKVPAETVGGGHEMANKELFGNSEQLDDTISRRAAIEAMSELQGRSASKSELIGISKAWKRIKALPSAQQWIPCSERLPEDLEPVNITWVNHEPEPYYHDIKNKNFVATGIHYRGQWYWYSTTCADYLGEYGSNDIDLVDDAIEIVAWMPLPEPWKGEE